MKSTIKKLISKDGESEAIISINRLSSEVIQKFEKCYEEYSAKDIF